MPTKRKQTKEHPINESDAPSEEQKKDQVRVITEIVEVIEEKPDESLTSEDALEEEMKAENSHISDDDNGETNESPQSDMKEAGLSADKEEEMSNISAQPTGAETKKITDEEKRKEVVEDLFKSDEKHMMPGISVHTQNSSRSLYSWAFAVILIALVIGGVLYVVVKRPFSLPLLSAKPTPTPMLTVTPTPQPVDRDMLTVQVLNGGGTPGAAGKMKTLLEEKGYKVSDVGNTDEYTYEKTEILVKQAKQAALTLLEQDLGEDYILGTVSATLSDDVIFDARVIVGKE